MSSSGEAQELNDAASSAQSKLSPASLLENRNSALVLAVVAGGIASMVVSGARSIVQARVSALSSTLPAASMARTANVWSPSPRSPYSAGEVQAENGTPSSEHSKVAPGSAVKMNCALVLVVVPDGPDDIVVCGSSLSTCQVYVAGVASMLPASSTARTEKVCSPLTRLT